MFEGFLLLFTSVFSQDIRAKAQNWIVGWAQNLKVSCLGHHRGSSSPNSPGSQARVLEERPAGAEISIHNRANALSRLSLQQTR